MKKSTESRVLQVINELFGEEAQQVELGAKIGSDIAQTSLERMTLFIALEDEFESTIPQVEVESLETVEEVVEFIENKIAV